MKSALWVSLVLVVVAVAALATPTSANKGLVNTDVKRTIILYSSVAKNEMVINVLNEGSAPESAYDLAIQEETLSRLAYMTVMDNDAKSLDWKIVEQARNIQANGVLIARYVRRSGWPWTLLDLSQRPDLLALCTLGRAIALSVLL